MSDLSDVERDAAQALRALAGFTRHLDRSARGPDGEPEEVRILRSLADEGGAAGERVLAYLRALRGAGDGVATAYPPRLGPWRNWCPPRGSLLAGRLGESRDSGRSPTRPVRRGDPGE